MVQVKNPCVGACSISWGDVICTGCGRHFTEVRDWNSATEERKKQIADKAKKRLESMEGVKNESRNC